jgi:transcriptional regulator with XRE-family HTH domain
MAGKPPGESDIAIGSNLRRLRKRAGLTQRDLGDLFGVSAAQAQKFETGKNRLSYERALTFCARLGIPVDELFAGAALPNLGGFGETAQHTYQASDPWTDVAEAVIAAARELDEPARSRIAEACRRISDRLA